MVKKPTRTEWQRAHQAGKGITLKTETGYVRAVIWSGDVYWSEDGVEKKKPVSELRPGDIRGTGMFG